MGNYQQEERKLCFIDCVWDVIFKWRLVCVSVVLFAVLFGALKYVKDCKANAEIAANRETSAEDIQVQFQHLSDIDKAEAETTMHLVKSLIAKNKYAQNAAIMKLNCYDVNRVILRYYVKSEKNTSELLQVYSTSYLEPEALASIVTDSEGTIQETDVPDMIITKNGAAAFQMYEADKYIISGGEENSLLYITIRGNDEEQAQKFADRIKQILEDCSAEAENLYGSHSLMLIGESHLRGRDEEIESLQDDVYKSIYEMKRDITEITGKMSKEAAQVVDNFTVALNKGLSEQNNPEIEETEKSNNIKASISKKWILLGAVFGAMLIGGIEVLSWLLGGKLNSSEELSQNFDIQIYGILEERKKRKILRKIDELLYKLKNRNKKILNKKQTLQMILSEISLSAKKEKISSIYLTGTEIESMGEKEIIKELKFKLEQEKIDLIIGQNILSDSNALLRMVQTGNVILLEGIRCSKYQEIVRELEICRNQGVNVLGSIVFDV